MFVTCLPPRYSPQIDTNEKSCSFAFGTFRSISQLKIGIKFHNTVLHVPFSLSLLFLLGLSHNAFKKKTIKEKRKIQQTTNLKLVSSMWWRDFTRMPGMNEKDTHRVLASDYFSDSWLVRFWQYLAYFSNKDYRNHETVLTETTRTKLGTRRLWIFFSFLVKCWKWTFIFNCEPGGPGRFKKRFTPGAPFPVLCQVKSLLIF